MRFNIQIVDNKAAKEMGNLKILLTMISIKKILIKLKNKKRMVNNNKKKFIMIEKQQTLTIKIKAVIMILIKNK